MTLGFKKTGRPSTVQLPLLTATVCGGDIVDKLPTLQIIFCTFSFGVAMASHDPTLDLFP